MDLYYGVHPPTEVETSISRGISARSRSPSPLSLRDPQDDGKYDMGDDDSSNDEKRGTGSAQQQQQYQHRQHRPLPLSVVAASLDLPSLTHTRSISGGGVGNNPSAISSVSSPAAAASRRYRLGLPELHEEVSAKPVGAPPLSSSSPSSSTLPLKQQQQPRSEAPFDEATPQRPAVVVHNTTTSQSSSPFQTATTAAAISTPLHGTPVLATNAGTTPSSIISSVVVALMEEEEEEEEPPACVLQEPPSLKTFRHEPQQPEQTEQQPLQAQQQRRSLSSAMPPATSPSPKKPSSSSAARSISNKNINADSSSPSKQLFFAPRQNRLSSASTSQQSVTSEAKSLPFEDEHEQEVEEKKTNEPAAPLVAALPQQQQHLQQHQQQQQHHQWTQQQTAWWHQQQLQQHQQGNQQQWKPPTTQHQEQRPPETQLQLVPPSQQQQHESPNRSADPPYLAQTPPPKSPKARWPPSPQHNAQQADPPPFSPAPEARSWMEEEHEKRVVRRLAPSPQDPPIRRKLGSVATSETQSLSSKSSPEKEQSQWPPTHPAHAAATQIPAVSQSMSQRQQARDRIKNRIRNAQSFDPEQQFSGVDHTMQDRPLLIDSSQSFDYPEGSLKNPIEIKRTTSLDIQSPLLNDHLDLSTSSLPGVLEDEESLLLARPRSLFHQKNDNRVLDDVRRRDRRLKLSQAEYSAMRAKQHPSPDKEPVDEVPIIMPKKHTTGAMPQSHDDSLEPGRIVANGTGTPPSGDGTSPTRKQSSPLQRKAVDPPAESGHLPDPTQATHWQPQPFQESTSLDGTELKAKWPPSATNLESPQPFQRTTSLDGPQFKRPESSSLVNRASSVGPDSRKPHNEQQIKTANQASSTSRSVSVGPGPRITQTQKQPSNAEWDSSPGNSASRSTSLNGSQYRTPHVEQPKLSVMRTGEPPSLCRSESIEEEPYGKQLATPQTPRASTEEPPSLSRPKPQETTPRTSNATALSLPKPAKRRSAEPVGNSTELKDASNDDDSESLGSIDTANLIASMDDLLKDLEERASKAHSSELQTGPASHDKTQSSTEFFKPLLVQSINNDLGVPKGDVMLSLLNDFSEQTWASRVTEAIWRCRIMRQNCDTKWLRQNMERKPGSPSRGRTSVAIDLDDNNIVGGIETVEETQRSALEHLKYDDFEDALSLYESIAGSYFRYFDGLIRKSVNLPQAVLMERLAYFKAFIGACTHNIGVIHLLRGEYAEAYSCFDRATSKRAECHGVGTTDHLASFVKKAVCQMAMDDLVEAAKSYEECWGLAQRSAKSISDQRQMAEILNNLACLAYLAGRPEKSLELFKESWKAQSVALDHSLYAGARFSCHSSTLNISVTRGNIGFLAILGRDIPAALEAFEYAVNQQQLLLRDAHKTLISSLEHLVVVQVIAGNKEKAIRLLRRMYLMQVDAFGPEDRRCIATNDKIVMIQETGKFEMDKSSATDGKDDTKTRHTNPVMKMFKKLSNKKK